MRKAWAWTHPKKPPLYHHLEGVCEGAGGGVAGLGRGVGVPVAAADPGDERGHLPIYRVPIYIVFSFIMRICYDIKILSVIHRPWWRCRCLAGGWLSPGSLPAPTWWEPPGAPDSQQ